MKETIAMSFRPIVQKRSHEQWSLKPQDFLLGVALALRASTPVSSDQIGLTVAGLRDSMARLKAARLAIEFEGALHIVLPAFLPFVVFAAPYCWPAVIGEVVKGQRTAFCDENESGKMFVWPDEYGECVGTSILPLHKAVPGAVRRNASLGHALRIFDALRVESGGVRDRAISQLQSLLTA